MDIDERLTKLESELIVLRRYLRAVLSLLPNDAAVNLIFRNEQRQIAMDANAVPDPQAAQALRDANAAFAYEQIQKKGCLAGQAPPD